MTPRKKKLKLEQVLDIHAEQIAVHGGSPGVRDLGLVKSAVEQPFASFDGTELYPTMIDKAVALAFSLVKNHAFIDGNKRVGAAALDTFLVMNGYWLDTSAAEGHAVIFGVAAGTVSRAEFHEWVAAHVRPRNPDTTGAKPHGP